MVCYVLTVARNFPVYHPKAGQPTNFLQSISDGSKIHTCRANFKFWKHRIDKINRGEAYLSIRQWSGKAYQSKQEEAMRLTKVDYAPVRIYVGERTKVVINGAVASLTEFARNDGFPDTADFKSWFRGNFEGICIYLNDFRYAV